MSPTAAVTASPDNNDLTARSLTFSNIENTSKASASSYGIVLGPGGIPLPVVGQPAKQNDHGETLATLTPGHLTLSDQTKDLASLNTDPSKATDQAKPFDIDKLQNSSRAPQHCRSCSTWRLAISPRSSALTKAARKRSRCMRRPAQSRR
jgi:hypothetical protein